MSPDHTPYLRPGVDLITAEDVLGWLHERVDPGWSRNAGRGEFSHALRARLDRERRQACRRAALDHWRRYRVAARLLAKAANARERFEYETCGTRLRAAALAFRAAARAR